jgi:PhnB protein
MHFHGTCEEALGFYKSVFGGEIVGGINRYGGSPMMEGAPAGWESKVLHAVFEAPGVKFMASDVAHPRNADGMISLSIGTSDKSEGERVFNALAQGGTVEMPFQPSFWGSIFGMVTDKFGIDWMVSSDQ